MADTGMKRTVLVTGGSNGIGRGIVDAFLAQGDAVALLDLKPVAPPNAPANRLLLLQGDVSRPESADSAIERCYGEWQKLDVVVNNAGIYPNSPVVEMDIAEWRRVMGVNLDGPFLMSRAYAKRAISANQPGCIINISSGAARSGRLGASHYCSSKAAVEMFTRVLAMELAPYRIRVNAIAPGLIDVRSETNPEPISEEYRHALLKTIPMEHAGSPADVAGVAVFLASDAARYMTGSFVTVDGGSLAGRNQLPRS